MAIQLVHVSDFHYKNNWAEEIGVLQSAFLDDLERQTVTKPGDYYLMFSGDVVKAANDNELYAAFADAFDARLSSIGIGRDKRFVCPGNHDVSRTELKPRLFAQLSAVKSCDDEETANGILFPEFGDELNKKFANFSEFTSRFVDSFVASEYKGSGFSISSEIGVYALNTAICSFGGIEDHKGNKISDKRLLHVYTRSLHEWLQSTNFRRRILLMHHPLTWLSNWAEKELKAAIRSHFDLVLTGHEHTQDLFANQSSVGKCIHLEAPALFTRKSEELGYSISEFDADLTRLTVRYRQWTKACNFVTGTLLSKTDIGCVSFDLEERSVPSMTVDSRNLNPANISTTVQEALQARLKEDLMCYHNYAPCWLPRMISAEPETSSSNDLTVDSLGSLIGENGHFAIRAMPEFGLTSAGRWIALESWTATMTYYAFVDASTMQAHESAIHEAVEKSRQRDKVPADIPISGIIVDNWDPDDERHIRISNNLSKEYQESSLILLCRTPFVADLVNVSHPKLKFDISTKFLWALTREDIYNLTDDFLQSSELSDCEKVAARVLDDLESLNIHRTPLNAINLLKGVELHFDESPVNRTEVIERVLILLFARYNLIPKYSTKPDLKDCQFAIGGFCEKLVRGKRTTFQKSEFISAVDGYCEGKSIFLDSHLLFGFLCNENILHAKPSGYEFRFSYWLHFFAAHRMRHSSNFFDYISENRRYSEFPELLEFYSGIDRHRQDLVDRLTQDLSDLNDTLEERTKIPPSFEPFTKAKWHTSDKEVLEIEEEIDRSAEASALPREKRQAIADQSFDRSRAYKQELRQFLEQASFPHAVAVMEVASKVLRKSEHVDTEPKIKLLQQIVRCWTKICQLGVILCPVLAARGFASFEGFGFVVVDMPSDLSEESKRFGILSAIPRSIVRNYQRALFSKKNGPLLSQFTLSPDFEIFDKFLGAHIISIQRPPGWVESMKGYLDSCAKDTFMLHDVLRALIQERQISYITKSEDKEIKEVMATALLKHKTGKGNQGKKALDKEIKYIEGQLD